MIIPTGVEHADITRRHASSVTNAFMTSRMANNRAEGLRQTLAEAEAAVESRRSELAHFKSFNGHRANPADVIRLEKSLTIAVDAAAETRVELARAADHAAWAAQDFERVKSGALVAEWKDHRELIVSTWEKAKTAYVAHLDGLGSEPQEAGR